MKNISIDFDLSNGFRIIMRDVYFNRASHFYNMRDQDTIII